MSHKAADEPMLPGWARLPINRCNLPATILGGLTFQRHPAPLVLDGVAEFHRELFAMLDTLDDAAERARIFRAALDAHFCLGHLEDAGLERGRGKRAKANWLRVLRGWHFDADGREGAVLKGWVESRFGLVPRFHIEPLRDFTATAWRRYETMRAAGLYGTNALEAQFDLIYTYRQYEYARVGATEGHVVLYRGINRLDAHEVLASRGKQQIVLLNNVNSFTNQRERAGEFGDYILTARIPCAKVFFSADLLPGVLQGEGEYIVIGGLYEVRVDTL